MATFDSLMAMAIDQAEESLREGNCGFGAVIERNGEIVACCRDAEKTAQDPTAHAELLAVRQAASMLGRDLSGCRIVSTHEPCPMCATAILWAGIDTLAFGCSIKEALRQGRRRIDLECREIFARAGKYAAIHEGVLAERCVLLYRSDVRDQIDLLRNPQESTLAESVRHLTIRRSRWMDSWLAKKPEKGPPLDTAYEGLLCKLGLTPEQAPIVARTDGHITFQSRNFCPTLEACRILQLDTRMVCQRLTEGPTNDMLRRIDPRLRFSRDYSTLRPLSDCCTETISLAR